MENNHKIPSGKNQFAGELLGYRCLNGVLIVILYQTKVSMNDDGSLLFPSITICKDEMFVNVKYSDRGLLTRLQTGEVSAENARSWFVNRTFSRSDLVKFLSIKTVKGSDQNNFPCNAASGPRQS